MKEHEDFARLRAFIALLLKYDSPCSEAEIEEIVRCALKGGYEFKTEVYLRSVAVNIFSEIDPTLADIAFDL